MSAAKELLAAMKADGWKPKRRTYAPIVEFHPAQTMNDLCALNRLYLEAEADEVDFGLDEFCCLLKACASATNNSEPKVTEGAAAAAAAAAAENGDASVTSREDFFESTLHRMKQLVPVASRAVLDVLREWSEQHKLTTTLSRCTVSVQEPTAHDSGSAAAERTTPSDGNSRSTYTSSSEISCSEISCPEIS